MRSPLVPMLSLAGLALGFLAARIEADPGSERASSGAAFADGLRIWPFGLMDSVRDPLAVVTMGVQLYNAGAAPVYLDQLELLDDRGDSMARLPLHGEALAGDRGAVEELHQLMEAVSPDLSHRHNHRLFIPLDQRAELDPETEARMLTRIVAGVRELQAGGAAQLRNLRFAVDLGKVLGAGALPGDSGVLTVVVSGRTADGAAWSARLAHEIGLLEALFGPPAERLGANVVDFEGLSKGFGDRMLIGSAPTAPARGTPATCTCTTAATRPSPAATPAPRNHSTSQGLSPTRN